MNTPHNAENDARREPPAGWYVFGTHGDVPVRLEFSEETDDALMPLWERPLPTSAPHTPSGGTATVGEKPSHRVDDQQERQAATAPPEGFHCDEAKAWHDNYDGMFWRWVDCDTERLALKEALRQAELRARIAEQDAELTRVLPPGSSDA